MTIGGLVGRMPRPVTLATMPAEFEHATAVTLIDGTTPLTAAADGATARFAADIASGWGVAGMTNGGYLLAIVTRAMIAASRRRPLTVTAHYLKPAPPGPCTIDVTALRVGRRMATLRAALTVADGTALTVLATLEDPAAAGDHADAEPALTVASPVPPRDQCAARAPFDPAGGEDDPGFVARVALAIRPDDLGFTTGAPTGTPEVQGWFAFPDQAPDDVLDACAVIVATDAFFPPVFNLGGAFAWVPTVELTVHLRATPVAGPLQARFYNTVVSGGLLNEDGELWDSAGNLVAQSRQLALVPRRR